MCQLFLSKTLVSCDGFLSNVSLSAFVVCTCLLEGYWKMIFLFDDFYKWFFIFSYLSTFYIISNKTNKKRVQLGILFVEKIMSDECMKKF